MRTSIPAGAPCRLSVRNTSRPLLLRLLFLICLTAVLLTAGACKRKAEPLSETRFQLNTFVTITLYDNPDKAILEGAFALVKEYEGLKKIIVCTNSNLAAPKNYESGGFQLYDRKTNKSESA